MSRYGALRRPNPSAGKPRTEYTIYTFGAPPEGDHPVCWQKHGSLRGRRKAVRLARRLYKSGHFQRIEIKTRHFDRRAGRVMDRPFRIFGRTDSSRTRFVRFGPIDRALLAAACGLAILFLAALFAVVPIP